jgi:hypothetical protein
LNFRPSGYEYKQSEDENLTIVVESLYSTRSANSTPGVTDPITSSCRLGTSKNLARPPAMAAGETTSESVREASLCHSRDEVYPPKCSSVVVRSSFVEGLPSIKRCYCSLFHSSFRVTGARVTFTSPEIPLVSNEISSGL